MNEQNPWEPPSLQEAKALFGGLGAPWWVAGGWAIDLFLGRQTRPHSDVDLAVLRGDQERLQQQLAGWDIRVAHDGELTPWAAGDWLVSPRHQFWARPAPEAAWALEILLEEHRGDDWVFRRGASVTLPFDRFGRTSSDGIPYVCPEVALLFKAKEPDLERNAHDFASAARVLDDSAREWLRNALAMAHPGHPWLGPL